MLAALAACAAALPVAAVVEALLELCTAADEALARGHSRLLRWRMLPGRQDWLSPRTAALASALGWVRPAALLRAAVIAVVDGALAAGHAVRPVPAASAGEDGADVLQRAWRRAAPATLGACWLLLGWLVATYGEQLVALAGAPAIAQLLRTWAIAVALHSALGLRLLLSMFAEEMLAAAGLLSNQVWLERQLDAGSVRAAADGDWRASLRAAMRHGAALRGSSPA